MLLYMVRNICIITLLFIATLLWAQAGVYPLDAAYTRPWELADRLQEITELKPDIAHLDTLGYTGTRRLPIVALRVSDNADRDEPDEPAILFCGPHQGEEVLGLEIVLHNARALVQAYGEDEELTRLVNASEVWFVPVVCAEGWQWVAGGYYFLKRKNDTDSDYDGIFALRTDGVDLNKNYPTAWEQDENTNPASDYYKGPAPASEPEVQAMMGFLERERPAMAVFYHSSATGAYSENIFFPWRWEDGVTPEWRAMHAQAQQLAAVLPRDYAPGNYTVHTGYSFPRGYARNWAYSAHRTHAFTIEVGGNLPTPEGEGPGVIHPPAAQLRTILAKHWDACCVALRMLHRRLVCIRITDPRGEPLPGVAVHLPGWDDNPHLLPQRTGEDGRLWRYLPPGRWPVLIDHQLWWLDATRPEVRFRIVPRQP